MTDLLTQSDTATATPADSSDPAGDLGERRTFRASTLDEAVAEARSELGTEVELIEAHRVRRGGLGGFFATDLGVEITAVSRRTASAPTGDAEKDHTASIVTGLDRLIEHADASDRASAVVAQPEPHAPQETVQDSHPFAEQMMAIEEEVATLEWPVPTDGPSDLDQVAPSDEWPQPSASTPLVHPSEWVEQRHVAPPEPAQAEASAPVPDASDTILFDDQSFDDALADAFHEATDHDRAHVDRSPDTAATGVELAPPSRLLNNRPNEAGGSLDDLDALLRDVGIDLATVRSESTIVTGHASVPMRIDDVAALASAQLVESVEAFAGIDQRVAQISVTVRTHDGTTVSVATELAG